MVALGRTNTIVALVPLSGPVPSLVPLGTRAEDTHAIRTFRRNSPPLPCKDQTCAGADSAPGTWPVNLSSGLNDLPATGVTRRAVPRERRPRTNHGPLASETEHHPLRDPPDTPPPSVDGRARLRARAVSLHGDGRRLSCPLLPEKMRCD